MVLKNLTEKETEVVFQCLRCVATRKVIFDDWEFQTVFGIEFAIMKEIVRSLPNIDESKEEVQLPINNSLKNLLDCPQGRDSRWSNYISVSQAEVARIFSKWRGASIGKNFDSIK